MRIVKGLLAVLIAAFGLYAQEVMQTVVKQERETSAPIVTIEQYEQMRDTQKYVVIDVREPIEFYIEHLVPAINLPIGQVSSKIEAVIPGAAKSTTKIFAYCRSGSRARAAVETLNSLGYDSYVLAWGALATIKSVTEWPTVIGTTYIKADGTTTESCKPDTDHLLSRPLGKWSLVGTSVDMDLAYTESLRANIKKAFVWSDDKQEWSEMNSSGFAIKANQGFWVLR